MKIKIFDVNNAPNTAPKGRPVMHVTGSGVFTLNVHVVRQLGLKEGNTVKLAQDETKPKDWFLIPLQADKTGFVLRKKSGAGENLVFNSAGMAGLIFNTAGFKGKSGRIGIGSEAVPHDGVTLVPLITSALKNPDQK